MEQVEQVVLSLIIFFFLYFTFPVMKVFCENKLLFFLFAVRVVFDTLAVFSRRSSGYVFFFNCLFLLTVCY